ncbi:hypothetical protein [Trichothermofontia sp.]
MSGRQCGPPQAQARAEAGGVVWQHRTLGHTGPASQGGTTGETRTAAMPGPPEGVRAVVEPVVPKGNLGRSPVLQGGEYVNS